MNPEGLIYHYRGWAIIVWGLLTIISLALTPALENALQETGVVDEIGEAYRTQQLLQQKLKLDPDALTLVFQRFQNSAADNAQAEAEQTLNSVRDLPVVSADVGSAQFWQFDTEADYGILNKLSQQRVNTTLIEEHWDDMLRVAGPLKLGTLSALRRNFPLTNPRCQLMCWKKD